MDNLNKIEYLGIEKDEDGNENHIYGYKFSTGKIKLGEDDGSTLHNINIHDELMYMCAEVFEWRIIEHTFNYDLDKPEDFHEYMKKIRNNGYDTSLEDLKKHWNDDSDLI